jgi:nucleoside-diphosphate-sugar epimerase
MPKVVVLGATGNQGLPACKHLIKSGKGWEIIAVTRNTSSPAAKELEALGCTLAAADVFDSASLAELFKGVKDEYACFLVTNYWQKKIGYKGEIDWGIKVVEAVVADGRCNHFVCERLAHERGEQSAHGHASSLTACSNLSGFPSPWQIRRCPTRSPHLARS